MFNLSAAYREWGDDALARRFLQHGLAQQEDFGPDELLELLNDAIRQQRCELADTLLDAAAELIEDDSPLVPHLAATRGLLLGLQGEVREGIRWLWSAYGGHVQQQDWKGAGQDLLNLCEFCRQVGRLRAALRCATFAAEHLAAVQATDLAQRARQAARGIRQLLALRRQRPGLN
jgi:hypothetical protein